MKDQIDRRSFLRIAEMSLGMGVLYEFAPFLARGAEAGAITDFFKRVNGAAPASFTFAQFSDPHAGFQGPPDPLGSNAFESAVELINKRGQRPHFVLFTGDLTHDAESRDAHAQRMRLFNSIAGSINTAALHTVPGENDAALDGGVLYREYSGESHHSFDHKGIHFVGSTMSREAVPKSARTNSLGSRPTLDAFQRRRRSWFLRIGRCSTSSLNGNGLPRRRRRDERAGAL